MPAQGGALGFGINRLRSALKGRRNPPPFQGGQRYLGTIPGALPRAGILPAVGATTRSCRHVSRLWCSEFLLPPFPALTGWASFWRASSAPASALGLGRCGPGASALSRSVWNFPVVNCDFVIGNSSRNAAPEARNTVAQCARPERSEGEALGTRHNRMPSAVGAPEASVGQSSDPQT
jgi:hypothetical protein